MVEKKKRGRPKSKQSRDKRFYVRLNEDEANKLVDIMNYKDISESEAFRFALEMLHNMMF